MTSPLRLDQALTRAREDWWANTFSRRFRQDGFSFVIELLSQKYDRDWLAQRIVRALVEDAMRPGWSLAEGGYSDAETDMLCEQFEALDCSDWQPEGHLFDGLIKGRLHGGAAIVLGFDSDPLTPAPAPEDGQILKWLDVVRRDELIGLGKEEDRNSPNFGRERAFRVTGQHVRRGLEIDTSRLILCEGRKYESQLIHQYVDGYRFPWISVLQPVLEVIQAHGASWEAIAHLLKEMSIMWFRMRGLISAAANEDAAILQNRLALLSMGRSSDRMLFLDAGTEKGSGEEVGRTAVSFADMPGLMAEWSKLVAAAADMPVTRLMGMSPAGLNATGESDLTQWYDRVAAYERKSVKPKLERILSYLAGERVKIKFRPLWEPSAKDAATMRLQNAQADKVWFDMGGIEGVEAVISRAKDGTLGLEIDVDSKEKDLETINADPNRSPGTPPIASKPPTDGSLPPKAGAVDEPPRGSGSGESVP